MRRIFNYFTKVQQFRKKDILTVVVIFILDLIKTSVQDTPKNNFLLLNIYAKSSTVNVRLGCHCASELSVKYFFFLAIKIDPRTFWIKKRMFSSMSKFFVHIEIIKVLKNAGRKEVVKNFKRIGQQSSKLMHLLK